MSSGSVGKAPSISQEQQYNLSSVSAKGQVDNGLVERYSGSLVVVIPGDPVGKQSVRVAMRGGFAQKYMPQKTQDYEASCRREAWLSMSGRELFVGPVHLWLEVYLPIPKSWSKQKQAQALAGSIAPTKKPDSSNVLKAVEDGFTGVVWVDDCQVVGHQIIKRFSDAPCVMARITPLDLLSC